MNGGQTRSLGERSISQSVIEAIAEADDTDPVELTPPLYDVVDPDALDRIFAATPVENRTDRRVSFTYNGYAVTARGDGHVSVEALDE